VSYDYGGPTLSYGEVIRAIQERKLQKKEKLPSRKILIKVCNFKKEEKHIFEILSSLSYTKDLRNATDDFAHYCLDNFFREIARRHRLDKTEVRYLWPEELENLIRGVKFYSRAYIQEKIKHCAVVIKSGRIKYFVGSESEKEIDKIINLKDIDNEMSEFHGMCASSGKVLGRVKILESYAQVDKVQDEDILVTNMTSPRYMAAILRAGAIVTDEGGLTCHAAIIARELKKPCIIGTKIATKVLKDGDFVEVDANKGVVKIIKRA
jgi:phosphoenolpyruvate synthase/pyruvate phosphate dikinase